MRAVFTHTAIILTLSILLYFFQPESQQGFAYYHNEIAKGQVWRLLTAHFCHTNGYHLLLNGIGLIVTVSLFINTFKERLILPLLLFTGLFISLCVFYFEPSVYSYVGLSGVLHGLFSFAICDELKKRDKWGAVLCIGFIVKVAWEQLSGPSVSTEALIGATVLINAHLYGAIGGVIYFLAQQLWQQVLNKRITNIVK